MSKSIKPTTAIPTTSNVISLAEFFRTHSLMALERETRVYRCTLRAIDRGKSYNIKSLIKLVGHYGYDVEIRLIPRKNAIKEAA